MNTCCCTPSLKTSPRDFPAGESVFPGWVFQALKTPEAASNGVLARRGELPQAH